MAPAGRTGYHVRRMRERQVTVSDEFMSITIEQINGITAWITWLCPHCGHQRKLQVTLGVSQSVTCPHCNVKDEVMLDESADGEVG